MVKDYRGCNGKDGTIVKRACPVNIFFPNAFTPNGDGINDVYMPVGDGVLSFNMSIYNRWGQLVFESSDANHIWDGTYNGKPLVSDKYLYMATYSGYTNKRLHTYSQEGNIAIIR